MLLGAHVSAGGGLDRAIDRIEALGGQAVQLFTQSPRRWAPTEHDPEAIDRFRLRRREAGIRYVLCHALYLINLASPDRRLRRRSADALLATVAAAVQIDADVVFHVGSHGDAALAPSLRRIRGPIEAALAGASGLTHLLLENSAGGGGTIGRSVGELATIVDRLERHPRLGICLDTCHLWSSGIDITAPSAVNELAQEIDDRLGLGRVRALHVNDTRDPLGSNRDVHANIGQGVIGKQLAVLLGHRAFRDMPAILETPGRDGKGPDALEMRRLRRLCREAGIPIGEAGRA
ncbi:MAG TPA: deoxyribonuclease IV [Candidatus Limnocylindrales bacterium]|nr:deoxyribonuclease IV [Candidatus Limnocylindrales bacterium]